MTTLHVPVPDPEGYLMLRIPTVRRQKWKIPEVRCYRIHNGHLSILVRARLVDDLCLHVEQVGVVADIAEVVHADFAIVVLALALLGSSAALDRWGSRASFESRMEAKTKKCLELIACWMFVAVWPVAMGMDVRLC